jgi:twinkle protein
VATLARHAPCPACGSRDNLAVYDDGSSHCFGAECDYRRGPGEEEAAGDVAGAQGGGSRGAAPLPDFSGLEVRALKGRRLTRETCERYGYGVWEGKHVAPFRDAAGSVVAAKLRRPDKSFGWVGEKDKALPLFGQHLQGAGRQVVITEGEIDAMSVSQALGNRWPAVSLPDGAGSWKKSLSAALAWLDKFERVVLCLDMDKDGRAATDGAKELLPAGKVHLATLPLKDASEMVMAGRERELKDAIWNAPRWSPSGIVFGGDWLEEFRDDYRPPVAAYPWPRLQAMTRGIRAGETILVIAPSGGGKSTLCRSLVHGLVQGGTRVGVVSLEETLSMFMAPLVGYSLGRNIRAEDGNPAEDPAFVEELHRLESMVAGYKDDGDRDPDVIFDRARYMHASLGCDVIVLDHLTVLLADAGGGVEAADHLMARLEAHVKRTKMTLFVVMHLRKSDPRGQSFLDGKVPTQEDVRGSGNIAGFCGTHVAYVRDQSQPSTPGRLHLLKCRLSGLGKTGPCDKMRYDVGTGMLRSVDEGVVIDGDSL